MQNFQIEEYRAEVRQLQAATSQWYLSILNDEDCATDLTDDCTVHATTEDGLKTRVSEHNLILGSQVFCCYPRAWSNCCWMHPHCT